MMLSSSVITAATAVQPEGSPLKSGSEFKSSVSATARARGHLPETHWLEGPRL